MVSLHAVLVATVCFAVSPPTLSRLPVRLAARSAAGQAGGEASRMSQAVQSLTNRHLLAGITFWMYELPLAVSLH
jgi:hypothetical protein